MKTLFSTLRGACTAALVVLLATAGEATARVDGITGTGTGTTADPRVFNLVAMDANIVTGDANTIYAWGYADAATGVMQYPGPIADRQSGRHGQHHAQRTRCRCRYPSCFPDSRA